MAAASTPWMAPETTLATATSHTGHGACTRSSISRVKPNSCDSCMATAWMPWNMMEMPTTPGDEDGGERRTRRLAPPAAADPLADGREDVQEDEDEQERLDEGAGDELAQVLLQHGEVPLQQGDERLPAGLDRPGGSQRRCVVALGGVASVGVTGGHQSRRSFPVRLMNTVSSVGSVIDRSSDLVARLARPRGSPGGAASAGALARAPRRRPSTGARPGDALELALEDAAEAARGRRSTLTVTIVSAPDASA